MGFETTIHLQWHREEVPARLPHSTERRPYARPRVKGQDSEENRTKREFLAEWVRAVNEHGGFGNGSWDVSHDPSDLRAILKRHAGARGASSDAPIPKNLGFGGQVSFGQNGKLKGTASLKNWKKDSSEP